MVGSADNSLLTLSISLYHLGRRIGLISSVHFVDKVFHTSWNQVIVPNTEVLVYGGS